MTWIKTSDRKPDIGTWVLGHLGSDCDQSYYSVQRVIIRTGINTWEDSDTATPGVVPPVYWMPLPEGPR